jgi:hypothetical protein
VCHRADLNATEKIKMLPNQKLNYGRPSRSQLLYRLIYPGSRLKVGLCIMQDAVQQRHSKIKWNLFLSTKP